MDVDSGSFAVGSAGHPPPLLVRPGGQATYLPVVPTTPLGGPPRPAEIYHGQMAEGDLMLLYTDGLIESRESDVTEGMEHLAGLAAGAGTEAETFCTAVLSRLALVRSDDVALLAAQRLGAR
jgi:serine phosphatase RsbU (regulator of sigma subunit)